MGERFGLAAMPDRLRRIQARVNTAARNWTGDPEHDELATLSSAAEWADRTLVSDDHVRITPAEGDLGVLHAVRENVRTMLGASGPNVAAGLEPVPPAVLESDVRLAMGPGGAGYRPIGSAGAIVGLSNLRASRARRA